MTVEGTTLRAALRPYASGVAVLTAMTPAGPAGVTITSLTSLSAEPALVSFALADTSSTWARVKDCRWFGVHVLAGDQADLAARFAARGVDRFAPPTRWHTGPHGVPLLDDCLSWLVCSRHDRIRLGDHHLIVGAVNHAVTGGREEAERPGGPWTGDSLIHLHGALQPVASVALTALTEAGTAPL
ncbi:flavin reductase family protein [Streptomyces sp. NPDC101166]|uniref:flavin reductase family protein n=1 Tax=Streptomyces sp. NPDC101166 TaxID=3366120 RepID=UPI0037F3F1F0